MKKDHGDVTVLGRKERRMLQEEKFQKKDVLCRWQEEDMVKVYYDEAKRVQGEPEEMASMSEMEPQNDARVIAHGAQGNAQVEAHDAQVQDMYKDDDQEDYHGTKKGNN